MNPTSVERAKVLDCLWHLRGVRGHVPAGVEGDDLGQVLGNEEEPRRLADDALEVQVRLVARPPDGKWDARVEEGAASL